MSEEKIYKCDHHYQHIVKDIKNGEKLSAGWITEKDVKKYIQMACVDYARSKIPDKKTIPPEDSYDLGYNDATFDTQSNIEQDLQTLNN